MLLVADWLPEDVDDWAATEAKRAQSTSREDQKRVELAVLDRVGIAPGPGEGGDGDGRDGREEKEEVGGGRDLYLEDAHLRQLFGGW